MKIAWRVGVLVIALSCFGACRSSHAGPTPTPAFYIGSDYDTVVLEGMPLTIDIPSGLHLVVQGLPPGDAHGYCIVRPDSPDCHSGVTFFLAAIEGDASNAKPWGLTPDEALDWFDNRFQFDTVLKNETRAISIGSVAEHQACAFDRVFHDAVIDVPGVGVLWLSLVEELPPSSANEESGVFDRLLDSLRMSP